LFDFHTLLQKIAKISLSPFTLSEKELSRLYIALDKVTSPFVCHGESTLAHRCGSQLHLESSKIHSCPFLVRNCRQVHQRTYYEKYLTLLNSAHSRRRNSRPARESKIKKKTNKKQWLQTVYQLIGTSKILKQQSVLENVTSKRKVGRPKIKGIKN
jgi:hypothetical protein